MRILMIVPLLLAQFNLAAQCTETPVLTTTGGSCFGTAGLSLTGVTGPGQITWIKNNNPVLTIRAAYAPLGSVGGGNGQGSSSTQLNNPGGIFVDRNGNIYVADRDNHRVQRFAAGGGAGQTVAGGNAAGAALNQLNAPNGISVDHNGNLFICDQNNHRIVKWAPGATAGIIVAGGAGAGSALNRLNSPAGLFVDCTGNIFVADSNNHRVVRWAPGATSGTLVAGGNGAGNAANQLNNPKGITVDTTGNVYVSDKNNRVQRWTSGAAAGVTVAGTGEAGYATNQLSGVSALFIDPIGNLIIADGNNNRIQRWAPGATAGETIAGGNGSGSGNNQLAAPAGVFADSSGNLYISDRSNQRIQQWAPDFATTLASANVPGPGVYRAATTTFRGCNYSTGLVNIHPSGTPKAKTVTNTFNDICPGDSVNFFAFLITEAIAPSYQWKKNNTSLAGTDTALLITSDMTDGDVFSCRIVCNANGCLTNDTVTVSCDPVAVGPTYTFTGSGNWEDAANWAGGKIPPDVLASCAKIIINPAAGAECVLNKPQIISPGAIFEIKPDTKFILNGSMSIADGTADSLFGDYAADTTMRGTGLLESSVAALARIPFYERMDTAQLPGLERPAALPRQKILAMPEPGDQGQIGSCVAWATGYGMFSYIHNRIENNLKPDGSPDYGNGDKTFSPAFIYSQINGGVDIGSIIDEAMELLRFDGCCKMADMPNADDFLTQPTPAASQNAGAYHSTKSKIFQFGTLDIEAIKNVLYKGWPLVFGADIDYSFATCRGRGVKKLGDGRKVWYDYSYPYINPNSTCTNTTCYGSHAMVLCGYDDNVKAFKVINSWGTNKANGGFYWVHYEFFKKLVQYRSGSPRIFFLTSPRPEITVTSNPATDITGQSANLRYSITNNSTAVIGERGVCYSKTNKNPTTACTLAANVTVKDNGTGDGSGAGSYNMTIDGLEPNTQYYYRNYAKTSEGVIYSQPLFFVTTESCPGGSVTIGSQVWSCKNLDVTTYRNGDPIPQVTDADQWFNLTTGAWCYYNNDPANGTLYGKLYNWFAVNDPRGLAPQGWHVPTDAEFTTLTNSLGGVSVAGGKMKSTSTLWLSPNTGATNSSGWSGLPGGYRNMSGLFNGIGNYGSWWSSTEFGPNVLNLGLGWSYGSVDRSASYKVGALSVRCLRD